MKEVNEMTDEEVLQAFDNIGHFHFNFGNDEKGRKRSEEHFVKIKNKDIDYIREVLQQIYEFRELINKKRKN
ncbi:hypothetical protein [Staphylococcus saprophyticus]|uniref:hypothetical protein n=1 Tax=Staphylococcus saprophyticus TaxID=29385 RepID=UPI0022EB6158|nr:hypothetical protein [Staphylococcus saprophyticus]